MCREGMVAPSPAIRPPRYAGPYGRPPLRSPAQEHRLDSLGAERRYQPLGGVCHKRRASPPSYDVVSRAVYMRLAEKPARRIIGSVSLRIPGEHIRMKRQDVPCGRFDGCVPWLRPLIPEVMSPVVFLVGLARTSLFAGLSAVEMCVGTRALNLAAGKSWRWSPASSPLGTT